MSNSTAASEMPEDVAGAPPVSEALGIQSITFTPSALEKISSLLEEEQNPALALRVFVTGGGCSGLQYGFTFEEIVNDDDHVIEIGGVRILVDAISFQYLASAQIDFKTDINGEQFVISNPNAKTTCGCGSSFSD